MYSKEAPFWLNQTVGKFKRILSLPVIKRKKQCENKRVLLLSDKYKEEMKQDSFIQMFDRGSLLLSLL